MILRVGLSSSKWTFRIVRLPARFRIVRLPTR